MRTALKWTFIGVLGVLVLIQFVPYGRDHSNPPPETEPAWASDRTRELAEMACADCHSNETEWPWYSNVAPMSWLVQRDVDNGRDAWNWSEGTGEAHEASEQVADGTMPPRQYTLLHPDARLSSRERADLAAGFEATFDDGGGGGDSSGSGSDDSGSGGDD